ncbi:hypothetical protein C8D87_105498 [Lentzea atacamensis]|uniref:Uncharacterized protein n=1 Tax=Lentzea atacamensis TaxID=531938 RepID=A0ABX9E6K6_9PSEU|nr:hypothetical protein [Lentzea atacamensis]RAS65003.1 hypothetical protein C8D87_105498 [Lentzea atacamensis]
MTTLDLPGLLTDPVTLENLSHDEAEWAPAGAPAAAFHPQSTEDVQRSRRSSTRTWTSAAPSPASTAST